MEFNKLVKKDLFPILQKYGFKIAEEFKNILRFQSFLIEINIVFNNYENSCYISIGRKGKTLYELRNNAVKKFFNSSLSIEQVTPETFVQNLSNLFESQYGSKMLKGDIDSFIKFKIDEDINYTFELIRKQILRAAEKAWEDSDYVAFIENIDKIGISDLPKSYQLKYKIAKQKL